MLQTRGIIGHNIGLPWDALCHVAAPVFPLVLSRKDALLGWRTVGRNCLIVHSGFSRGAIHEGGYCRALDGVALCNGADLGKPARVLQVTVGDSASWVVGRGQLGLDLGCEGCLPHVRVSLSIVEDASHSGFGGVCSSKVTRILGDDLG